jgi:type IV secretion system protein VirB2
MAKDAHMKARRNASTVRRSLSLFVAQSAVSAPVMAQTTVFDTGANALVQWGLTIATPIAVLIVIAAGIAAAIGKISWGWVFGGIVGIAVVFGSEQIVTWIRGLFGV